MTVFIPAEDGRRYPDNWYEQAANTVRRLHHEKPLDIHSAEDIKRYYTTLLQDQKDKTALLEAINDRDYLTVSKEYHLIEQQGQQVIVPYAGEETLFASIRDEVLSNGVSGHVMRRAAGITVSVYEEGLERYAERLYYPKRNGNVTVPSQYYLLRPQYYSKLYSDKMGFQMEMPNMHDALLEW